MGEIILTQRAQQRLAVLNALERGEIGMADAAHLMGRSERQTRRLRREYRLRGPTALIHGNCGRPSPRRLPNALRQRIVALAQTTYAGANYLHLHELLAEREALTIAYTSLVRNASRIALFPASFFPTRQVTRSIVNSPESSIHLKFCILTVLRII